jgi:hypothetical protein
MNFIGRICLGLLGAAAIVLASAAPSAAAPRCVLAAGTQDGGNKSRAIEKSRATLEESIRNVQKQYGWRSVTVRPQRAKPDPLFKLVRQEIKPEWMLPPDSVSSRAYTTCWSGVQSPAVCTSGARVCGR